MPPTYTQGRTFTDPRGNQGTVNFDVNTGRQLAPGATTMFNPMIANGNLPPIIPVENAVNPSNLTLPQPPQFNNNQANAFMTGMVPSQQAVQSYQDFFTQQPGTESREQVQTNGLSDQIFSLLGQTTGRAQTLQGAENSQGLPKLQTELADINGQVATRSAEYNAQQAFLGTQPMSFAARSGYEQSIQNAKAADIGFLQASALAKTGQIENARSLAQRAVDLKYAPILEEIAAKQAQIELIKPTLTKQEAVRAKAQELALNKQEKEVAEARKDNLAKEDMLVNASSQNAPAELITRARNAKTRGEAAMILGQYAGDYYKTELLKQSIETEKAQRAKINSDIANNNAKARGAIALANLPTNQKIQANIASGKIQPGQLVSLSTGEIPKNVTGDKVDGLLALKDLNKKVAEYSDVYAQFEKEAVLGGAGLATGVKNKVFPSSTKTSMDGLRGEITDLLARARSGAALTAYETAEYEKKLPTSFNSSLGFGKQGTDKIKSFQSSLKGTLDTKLAGYGVTFAEGAEDGYLDTVDSAYGKTSNQGLDYTGYTSSLTTE